MTHDEVVLFAAAKLGVELILYPSWKGGAKYGYMRDECLVPFDLSSPDLMLKGMGAFDKVDGRWIEIQMSAIEVGISKVHSGDHGKSVFIDEIAVRDIPRTFWEAWAKLEGGQG